MTTWQFPPPVYGSSGASHWPAQYWWVMIAMWWVMMIAMMVPSAAPMISAVRAACQTPLSTTGGEQATPLLVPDRCYSWDWLPVCLATVQPGGHRLAMGPWNRCRPGARHDDVEYQSVCSRGSFCWRRVAIRLSPLKSVCLSHCRRPASFLSATLAQGFKGVRCVWVIDHGLYCVGCCWFLMLLLFVGGIMNLVWIAGLAIFVLLEKLLPRGVQVARWSGGMMVLAGSYLLLT